MFKNPSTVAAAPNGSGAAAPVVSQAEQAKRVTKAMAAITAVLLIGAGSALYLLNNNITAQEKIVADKQTQYGNAEVVARRYNASFTEYTQTASQLQYLEKSVAPNAYIPTLLPQIAHLAQTYNLSVSSMRPGVPVADPSSGVASAGASGTVAAPTYETVPIDISLSGTYSQIMRFVYSLTTFPKIMTVKSLSLHPGGPPPAPGQKATDMLAADVSLTAYQFLQDPSQVAAPAAPTAPPIGSISQTRSVQSDLVDQTIARPIGAAQTVQSETQQRVDGTGLQSQPAGMLPQTSLGKGSK